MTGERRADIERRAAEVGQLVGVQLHRQAELFGLVEHLPGFGGREADAFAERIHRIGLPGGRPIPLPRDGTASGAADIRGMRTVRTSIVCLAALLLALGLLADRARRDGGDEVPSWISSGPALVVGFAPTVWLACTEPGSARPLVGLVSGALVLIGGVAWGKRALVDVGTATVVALGLRQIAPVVGEVPNWVTIGATGVLLIVVGATFEQRRRDLRAVLRRYAALT
mgnify:CR=1 FL=1